MRTHTEIEYTPRHATPRHATHLYSLCMAITNLKGQIFLHNLLVSKHTLNFYSFHHLRFLFHVQASMDKDEKPSLQQHPTDSMKDQTFDLSDDFDQTPERFQCCICLDLLYKPIVLACGHISCFWCVHEAMCSISVQSYCPICRHPFHHFPSICQLLHSLLVKLYPVAYKRRAKQVLEEEKEIDMFSPQFDDHSEHISSERSNMEVVVDTLDCDTCCHDDTTTVPENSHPRYPKGSCNITLEETILPDDDQANAICEQVSINDVLCVACKQLLVRPSVLNCGHVYCESCILTAKDGSLTCQLCQSPHPGGFPKVCLELDNFLVEQFPKEHSYRREALQNKVRCHQEGLSPFEKEDSKYSVWHEHGSKVHIGFGCDTCGIFPIIGNRYKCLDCKEAAGFDLCENCYNTRSKLPGRFNQQHTPEHRFVLVQLDLIIMRIASEQSENSDGYSSSNDAPQEVGNTDASI